MAHKNAACHAREHNRYNVFWGPMLVFLSPNGPNDALFYNAIYSKYIFRFYCVLSVLSWF